MAWSEQQGASTTFVAQQGAIVGFSNVFQPGVFQNDVFQESSEEARYWESQQGASTTFVAQQEAA